MHPTIEMLLWWDSPIFPSHISKNMIQIYTTPYFPIFSAFKKLIIKYLQARC